MKKVLDEFSEEHPILFGILFIVFIYVLTHIFGMNKIY
jgi:hypothetical protein